MTKNSNIIYEEFKEQVFRNKKQMIKVVGLLFIAFLYGFITICAFWNPLENFDQIPAAILDLSEPTCLSVKNGYIDSEDIDQNSCESNGGYWGTMTSLELSTLIDSDGIIKIQDESSSLISANFQYLSGESAKTELNNNDYWDKLVIPPEFNDNIINFLNCILSVTEINATPGHTYEDWRRSYVDNLKVLTGEKVNNQPPQPNIFKNPQNGDYVDQNIVFQASLENNFLSMYFTNIFCEMINQISQQYFPKILNSYFIDQSLDNKDSNLIVKSNYMQLVQSNKIKDISENTDIKLSFPSLSIMLTCLQNDEIVDALFDGQNSIEVNIFEQNFNDEVLNYASFDLGDLIAVNIQGMEHDEYGIGLGKFFICIGIFVGAFIMTVVFTRKFANNQKSVWKNYFAKIVLMNTIGFLQVTILFLGITAVGFYELGAYLLLLYLWALFSDFVFINLICGFWFLIRDETFSKLAIMVIIVISITSCGGIFPSVLQSNFFNFIGYLSPFLFSLNGQSIIIYGISVLGSSSMYANLILINFGYLTIFWVFFAGISYFGFWKNHRIRLFSTYSNKKTLQVIKELKFEHLVDDNNKILFNKISQSESEQIKRKMSEKFIRIKKKEYFFRDITDREIT
ncbi:hypothetical protein [Spiroplasma endosymbiont of Amphibalanus improvisus]|uniref:hypothetical protein n=1 Tax=Spiroplasma endosymbiont of Amphibalanus improvisus TaxID=3066327 RepID=UPI00313C643B